MDAKDLATALVSGGRCESEKIRLIRSSFPSGVVQLTKADIALVQERLGRDRRLFRLALEFADASCNQEFAIAELYNGNTITSGHVATRFHWLYSTDIILNEAFLSEELPKMSHSIRLKILNSIGNNLSDVELGDQLWRLVRTNFSLRYASRLLAACSNELILRELTASKIVQLTDAQMLQILKKRFETGSELLCKLSFLQASSELKQTVTFDNSMHYLLLRNFEKGFDTLTQAGMKMRFGVNRTRRLLKAYATGSGDRIVKYSIYLHRQTLRRYSPVDLYLECFLRNNIDPYFENDPLWRKQTFEPDKPESVRKLMSWLTGLSVSNKRHFLEVFFKKMYNRSIVDVPMKVFPEILHVLREDEWLRILNLRLQKKDYSLARTRIPASAEYFWRSMFPCELSFPDLKQLLATERSSGVRKILYSFMVTSAFVQRDGRAVEEQLEFVVGRCGHEIPIVLDAILETLEGCYCLENPVKANTWPSIKQLVDISLLRNNRHTHVSLFRLLFRLLKTINLKDIRTLKQVAGALSNVLVTRQLSWPDNFVQELKRLHRHVRELILKAILQEQESFLAKKREDRYSQTWHVWRVFQALDELEVKIDFSQYPNNSDFLKYVVSMKSKGMMYWEGDKQAIRRAYRHIKDILTQDDSSLTSEMDEANDAEALCRAMRDTHDVGDVNIAVILSGIRPALLRRICQTIAASGAITSSMLQTSLTLLDDDDRRLTAAQFLAMCMPLSDYKQLFARYAPEEAGVNAKQIELYCTKVHKALLTATKSIADSATALEMLCSVMHGNYLKMAVSSFDHHCSKSPPGILLPFLIDNLTSGSLSAQKHFLRWFFIYAPDNIVKFNELIAATKNGSIKLELVKLAYRKIEDYGDDAWPILKSCLDILRREDTQALDFLVSNDSIDDRLDNSLPHLFQYTLLLAGDISNAPAPRFDCFLKRAANCISKFPQDLAQTICIRAFEQLRFSTTVEESKQRLKPQAIGYIGHFALQRSEANFEFLENQLELLVKGPNEHMGPALWIVTRTLCNAVVHKKRTDGTDLSPLLRALHKLLKSDIATCLLQSVYVELTEMMMGLLPAKDPAQAEVVSFIQSSTLKGITLLCEHLDQLGNQMLRLLAPLLTNAIESVIGTETKHRARMIEVYKIDSPIRHAWFLIDCLPSRGSACYIKDSEIYDGFIDRIQQGSDVALKIMLKCKLEDENSKY